MTTRASERLDDGVFRTELPEGPIVLSERIDSVRSVALGLWVRQGSAHEPPGQGGISHLLEHLVFKGTSHRSAHQLAREIEQVGGGMDAYTAHEVTAFQAHVPDD
jgi:predicted Zn-dependent peptidase